MYIFRMMPSRLPHLHACSRLDGHHYKILELLRSNQDLVFMWRCGKAFRVRKREENMAAKMAKLLQPFR